jgi:hypothetical protein
MWSLHPVGGDFKTTDYKALEPQVHHIDKPTTDNKELTSFLTVSITCCVVEGYIKLTVYTTNIL